MALWSTYKAYSTNSPTHLLMQPTRKSVCLSWKSSFLLITHNRLKMDRVDSLFYIHSDRIDLSDETRIKSTSEEANEWIKTNQGPRGRAALSYTARLTPFFESFGTQLHFRNILPLHRDGALWLFQDHRFVYWCFKARWRLWEAYWLGWTGEIVGGRKWFTRLLIQGYSMKKPDSSTKSHWDGD